MSLNQILAETLGKKTLTIPEKTALLDQIPPILINNFGGLQTCYLKDLHLSGWEKPLGTDVFLWSDEVGDDINKLYGLFCDCQSGLPSRDPIDPTFAAAIQYATNKLPNAVRRIWGVANNVGWIVITFTITQSREFFRRPERVRSVSIARATSLQLQEAYGFSFDTLLGQIGHYIGDSVETAKRNLSSARTAQDQLSFLMEWNRVTGLARASAATDDIPY